VERQETPHRRLEGLKNPKELVLKKRNSGKKYIRPWHHFLNFVSTSSACFVPGR
jgi:hypothetical protein